MITPFGKIRGKNMQVVGKIPLCKRRYTGLGYTLEVPVILVCENVELSERDKRRAELLAELERLDATV
jgi:hypothetical protein